MSFALATTILLASWYAQAGPTPQKPPTLAEDPELQANLQQAYKSGVAHLVGLGETIERIAEDQTITDLHDFKVGALAVLQHGEYAKDGASELYLRLLQQPVLQDIFSQSEAAGQIQIDGARKGWPREAMLFFPKPESAKKDKETFKLHSLGVLRNSEDLFALFEVNQRPESVHQLVYSLEISKLATQFTEVAYSVKVASKKIRILDSSGEEIDADPDSKAEFSASGKNLELRVPLSKFEKDLRSIAVRGYLNDRKNKNPGPTVKSPWTSCPTGSVTTPTEMLLYLATQKELPAGDSFPVALALQEGMLLFNSHADLADQIKKDAAEWLELTLDIGARMDAMDLPPPSKLPVSAQLAWACRYDGFQPLNTVEEYEFRVPSPKTIASMRHYAEMSGWLSVGNPGILHNKLREFMAQEAKTFDYPDDEARQKGEEFEDPKKEAYYVKGDNKWLSYRDVGINLRWKLFDEGLGLKGNQQQINQFQRALSLALGLPTLWARHHNTDNDALYTISYDGQSRKWIAIGSPTPKISDRAEIVFSWGKPWTRPERFEFWHEHPELLPDGAAHLLLDGGFNAVTAKQFDGMLEKGFSDKLIAKSFLAPLR